MLGDDNHRGDNPRRCGIAVCDVVEARRLNRVDKVVYRCALCRCGHCLHLEICSNAENYKQRGVNRECS